MGIRRRHFDELNFGETLMLLAGVVLIATVAMGLLS
jgi:hypothetical protein